MSGIKTFQMGVKRALEHGHRLNLALAGYGDLGISVNFNSQRSVDEFRDAEAEYMRSQAVLSQLEAMVISPEEARKILGLEDKPAGAGEFVASFNRLENRYHKVVPQQTIWQLSGRGPIGLGNAAGNLFSSDNELETEYQNYIENSFSDACDKGIDSFISRLMTGGDGSVPSFISTEELIKEIERFINTSRISDIAADYLEEEWKQAKAQKGLFASNVDKFTGSPSLEEFAVIAYLASRVEPFMVGSYLSTV